MKFTTTVFMLVILLNGSLLSQDNSIDFQVKTKTYNGHYSPKNVGVIWIEDSQNNFIKTLKVWGDNRRKHLVKWNNASNENVIDAVTGATKSSHITHQTQWNFTDVNQQVVSDGQYKIFIEFTEENSKENGKLGEWIVVNFDKTDTSYSLSFDDQNYFEDIELEYICNSCLYIDELNINSGYELYQNYPNPFNPETNIKFNLETDSRVSLRIYDLTGNLINTVIDSRHIAGTHSYIWSGINNTGKKVPSGVYIYRLYTDNKYKSKKMLLLY